MAVTTQSCCGRPIFQYDDRRSYSYKRVCYTCRYCNAHFCLFEGKVTKFQKEQQCFCYEIRAYKNAEGCCIPTLRENANWYYFGDYGHFCCCNICFKVYNITNISNQTYCLGIFMGSPKPITSKNYIQHYITWCRVNQWAPLRWDVLYTIFEGCETNEDYKDSLDALLEIHQTGWSLSFMDEKQLKSLDALMLKLKIRLELFRRVPSGNNMLLAYALIEEITLKKFSEIQGDLDDRLVDKFDKCKNLAIGSKFIPERKVAFERSFELFKKFAKIDKI